MYWARGAVHLDDAGADLRVLGFQLLGEAQADIAAAQDDDAPRLRLLVAEGGHGAGQVAGVGDEIDLVAGQHLVVAAGDDRLVVADDRRRLPG